jgi:SAM-dependent methyltransferase
MDIGSSDGHAARVTTATDRYPYNNDWVDARQRLNLLEEVFDPGTIRHLEQLGVSEGWRCLEVGAGAGSIARWLSTRVGSAGRVLATDSDVRLLEPMRRPNLEVQRHDILTDDLPERAFDLIHARALLCHLPERERALDRIVGSLKPGGWLLIEEPDFVSEHLVGTDSHAQALFRKVTGAKAQLDAARGFDPEYGRRVFDALRRRGLGKVAAEGRTPITAGASPIARFWTVSLMQVRARFLAAGEVTEADLTAYADLLADPSSVFIWPVMVATWGQRGEQRSALAHLLADGHVPRT